MANSGQGGRGLRPADIPRTRLCVGLMSGTSMDGVHAALVEISGPANHPRVQMHAFASVPYPVLLRTRLLHVASGHPTTAAGISELNFLVGEMFAQAAQVVCRRAGIRPDQLAVIGSHGQTVFHQGKAITALESRHRTSTTPSTLQIGEPAIIAQRTRACVIADFRTADMAAGGEGAPLVPLIDYLLLRHTKIGTLALNIGGIANITVIEAAARQEDVYGFDTGPGNMVMDALVSRTTQGRESFDADGRMASSGTIDKRVLNEILRLPFFSHPPPKSAGREQFGADFVDHFFRAKRGKTSCDLVATATELTARSIALAVQNFVPRRKRKGRMVVSGGGAHNRFLLARLAAHLPTFEIRLSDDFGLPADTKEAIAFALLADRTLHGLPGNLPRVTGARWPVVLGKVVRP
ncbi:MAG: anhydro-N-acetylmuramic acid kinase [Terriglobia bacterium]